MENELYLRKVTLLLLKGGSQQALDLSEMHITFETRQEDQEQPNNCRIRVHNLGREITKTIMREYTRVVLQAGYEGAYYGVIFDGTIKQWGEGREANKVDTYLDILAADGDIAYNFSVVRASLAAGSTPQQRISAAAKAMNPDGVKEGTVIINQTGGILPRGKVLFGLASAALRAETGSVGNTWNITNGVVTSIPLRGYLPGQAVVLTSSTGLIGRPELTQEGVKCRCLINPKIQIGGLVQLDNAGLNKVSQQKDHVIPGAQLPYNQWAGIQNIAFEGADGIYRVYVAEYRGDNRGQAWWMDLIMLAVDPVDKQVICRR